jgi:hypothetical protein
MVPWYISRKLGWEDMGMKRIMETPLEMHMKSNNPKKKMPKKNKRKKMNQRKNLAS